MSKKLVLIDGHSILNRAFYGVPDLTNAQGTHTNAVYGFLNILFKVLEEEKPQYLCVAFDVKAPTFRHKMYEAYKGTRKPMPQELHEQVPIIQDVLRAMQITIVTRPGYEADDILGTLAKRAEKEDMEVTLVSGDRDLLQIASDHIKIRIPKTKGGRTETEDYYTKDVIEKYRVNPQQFIDLKALMGDTADNIPGVPKVGEKTATELMVQYGSLQGIYEHVDEISKNSIKESLKQNEDLAKLSKELATIKTDCELSITLADTEIKDFYTKEAYAIFQKLEFKNFLSRFDDSVAQAKTEEKFVLITELADCEAVFEKAAKQERSAYLILEDEKEELSFAALALAFSKEDIYVILPQGFVTKGYLTQKLQELSKKCELTSFDCKKQYDYVLQNHNTKMTDILIAAYLLNPLKSNYSIEDIANEYLGNLLTERNRILQKMSLCEAAGKMPEAFLQYAGERISTIFKVTPILLEKLKKRGMEKLFFEIEMPLSVVLYEMEREGILINKEELKRYGESLKDRIDELEKIIYEKAGTTFNINSPKQLGEILFEKMRIPGGKKTKTGYSTAAEVLEKLSEEYPIVSDILEYRGLTKLKSTYADGLYQCIASDGRIHTTFNQTITATGRISSTEPNLQNIPMRMELGRKIRKAFIPKDGYVFMDADYSQIELRLLAHMSRDEQLIEAYKQDADIHRITASKVFHTPFEEVTDLQRRNAKAVNFGIIYGISSFGLSQDLGINRKESEQYINEYFEQYPDVKRFLDETVEQAKQDGYVTTLYGRRRPIPELKSANFMQRSFGQRVAMNSPIQGTAADIMKIAMIHVWEELKKRNLQSKILVQVHDELLLEVAKEEVTIVKEILTEKMKSAADLAVMLEVDVHTGADWYEAK